MPDAPSDWLGFTEYLGLTGDDIARQEREAQAKASAFGAQAGDALTRAGQQSRTGQSGYDVTQQAAYGDYLKLRQQMVQATAAPRGTSAYERAAFSRGWSPGAPAIAGELQGREARLQETAGATRDRAGDVARRNALLGRDEAKERQSAHDAQARGNMDAQMAKTLAEWERRALAMQRNANNSLARSPAFWNEDVAALNSEWDGIRKWAAKTGYNLDPWSQAFRGKADEAAREGLGSAYGSGNPAYRAYRWAPGTDWTGPADLNDKRYAQWAQPPGHPQNWGGT